jgi:HK97 family phage major capsid protein
MTYIPRSGTEALMPEEWQKEIVQVLPEQSSVMTLAYRAPDMSRAQKRIPVLSVLPTAYFLNPGPTQRSDATDIARKRLTRQLWENKYLDAEELAVIVAVPEAVVEDVDYDLWNEVKPKLVEAFGLAFDQAVFYGVNAPAAWPTNLLTGAESAGNLVVPGSLGSETDIYDEILGEGGVISKVEEDGFMVSGHVAALTMRAKLRGLRDENGVPIFKSLYKEGVQGATRYELDGEQVVFPRNGSMIPEIGQLISGDWRQLIWALRKDITWKILTEAVIQDPTTGEILYNLAQQDMVGLRAVMRIAWQVPNPVNRIKEDASERYPFAVYGQQTGS